MANFVGIGDEKRVVIDERTVILAYDKLSGSYPIVLENPQNIYSFRQISEVQFPAQNSSLEHLGTEHIKNQNLFRSIFWGFNINLALCHRIGIQL